MKGIEKEIIKLSKEVGPPDYFSCNPPISCIVSTQADVQKHVKYTPKSFDISNKLDNTLKPSVKSSIACISSIQQMNDL